MSESTQSDGGSVHVSTIVRAPAERVYRAFLDPAALAKWWPPHGFTATIHHLDSREGGTYRATFTNLGADDSHSFEGTYLQLEPHRHIRSTCIFDDPALPGVLETDIHLETNIAGTRITVDQTGIPPQIPADYCALGWQECLELLRLLVEPEIPASL